MSLLAMTTLLAVIAATVATGIAWHQWRRERARTDARVRALDAAIEGGADVRDTGQHLFGSVHADRREWPPLGPAVVGIGVVVVLLVAGGWLLDGDGGARVDDSRTAPIDLLTMQHVTELSDFVVAGVVRNPATAERREGVAAVASFFDDKGGFITSARAPLDLVSLAPGAESSFRVKIPRPAGLERFRLSFRTADGSVLPHVDRRREQ